MSGWPFVLRTTSAWSVKKWATFNCSFKWNVRKWKQFSAGRMSICLFHFQSNWLDAQPSAFCSKIGSYCAQYHYHVAPGNPITLPWRSSWLNVLSIRCISRVLSLELGNTIQCVTWWKMFTLMKVHTSIYSVNKKVWIIAVHDGRHKRAANCMWNFYLLLQLLR